MSDELLDLAVRAAAPADPGEQVEAFVTHAVETSVTVFDGEVETLTSARTRGLGVRVIRDGRLGFAATADLSDEGLARALAEARSNAEYATEDAGNVLPGPAAAEPLPHIAKPGLDRLPAERKVALALELERLTRAADPRVSGVSAATYADAAARVAVASSRGVAADYERTDAYAWVSALARDGAETQTGFGLTEGRAPDELDLAAAAAEAAQRATRLLGARQPRTATVPVVFDPLVTAQFLGTLAGAFSAEAVQKGLSLLAARLGQRVLPPGFAVVDDGRLVEGPAAAPIDDEGVPTRRTVLVDDGVLTGWLHNTETAARDGSARSTGNAARGGHRTPPGVSASNMFLDGPTCSPQEILRRTGEGLYVQEVKGVHSGVNPVSGEFSVGATGLWVRDGELAEPVRELTVSSTLLEMLGQIVALGSDRRFFPMGGALGGATLLLGSMTVAGA